MIPSVNQWLAGSAPVVAWAGTRIFPNQAPENTKGRYIVFQVVGGMPENYLASNPTADNIRVQIACWADSALGASQGADLVRTAMEPYGMLTGYGESVFEPDTRKHGYRFDWSIWNLRDVGEEIPDETLGDDVDNAIRLAAATVNGLRAVMLAAGGGVRHLDCTDPANADNALGVSLGAAITGDSVTVRVGGAIDEASWTWTPLEAVYATGDGLLTQTVPTSPGSAFMLRIGFAETATRLFVDLGEPIYF